MSNIIEVKFVTIKKSTRSEQKYQITYTNKKNEIIKETCTDLIGEYFQYFKKYTDLLGTNTIILYQCGSFFETYSVRNDDTELGNGYIISNLLNILITRRSKSTIDNSLSNPLMCGFPLASLNRNMEVLLNNGYNVILVEQDPDDVQSRSVTQKLSPGININTQNQDTNYVMSVYIENENTTKIYNRGDKCFLTISSSIIDITTGEISIYEISSTKNDTNLAMDELHRFIKTYQPRQILINSRNYIIKDEQNTKDYLISALDLDDFFVTFKLNCVDPKIYRINNQVEYLETIHSDHGLLNVVEYLNLERMPTSTINYILLLKHIANHNEKLLINILKPTIIKTNDILLLAHDAVDQLNLLPLNKSKLRCDSILSVINRTNTSMGKRLLQKHLTTPITDTDELNRRYNIINSLISNDVNIKILRRIVDLERYHRKMGIGLLDPMSFMTLDNSYENILNLIEYLRILDDKYLMDMIPMDIEKLEEYMREYRKYFDMNEVGKYRLNDMSGNFLNEGISEKVDDIQKRISDIDDYFLDVSKTLSEIINKELKSKKMYELKINKTDKKLYISGTIQKCKLLEKIKNRLDHTDKRDKAIEQDDKYMAKLNLNDKQKKLVSTLEFHKSKSKWNMDSAFIREQSDKQLSLISKINKVLKEEYITIITKLYNKYHESWKSVTHFIAMIDVMHSHKQTAITNNYNRPVIEKKEHSYIKGKELRHPLVEVISNKKYISNDVELGYGTKCNGILLFALNAGGKSTLMKSIGINVILAQIGSYVAADEFIYSPYNEIITRITGNDNILKGLSSFAVEMTELRYIINRVQRAGPNTLVLGDEICRGTEYVSGISLIQASLITLSKSKSNYIFSSHMHNLTKRQRILDLDDLKFYHLKVRYDEDNDELVYDRKMIEGPGSTLYGIEVAKCMDMGEDFINLAMDIRDEEIMNNRKNIEMRCISKKKEVIPKKIRTLVWNTYIGEEHGIGQCHCCDCDIKISEWHCGHIKADSKGGVVSVDNLRPICAECNLSMGNMNMMEFIRKYDLKK